MLKFEQYTAKDYKQEDIDKICSLINGYTEEQKRKVALLLIDLANIYVNSNDNTS